MSRTIPLPIKGHCQCGALRYQIAEAPSMIYACHCTNCQRIAGSAFSVPATIREESLEFTSGTPQRVTWRSDAGNERYGFFCGDCGCRILHGQLPSNGIASVRASTFEDPSWIVAAGHIWTRSAQPWIRFGDDEIVYEKQPDDYAPFIERFQAAFSFE